MLSHNLITCNVGQLNAQSAFVFMNCPKKRLIVIEECLITPLNVNDFKMMMEGAEHCTVNVKGKPPTSMDWSTPLIITGNVIPWLSWCNSENEALSNRSYIYQFNKPIDEARVNKWLEKYQHVTHNHQIILSPLHLHLYYKKLQYELETEEWHNYLKRVTEEWLEQITQVDMEFKMNSLFSL